MWALIWKHSARAQWNNSKTRNSDKTKLSLHVRCDGLSSSGNFQSAEVFCCLFFVCVWRKENKSWYVYNYNCGDTADTSTNNMKAYTHTHTHYHIFLFFFWLIETYKRLISFSLLVWPPLFVLHLIVFTQEGRLIGLYYERKSADNSDNMSIIATKSPLCVCSRS